MLQGPMRHSTPSKPALLMASALVALCAGMAPAGASTFKAAADFEVLVDSGTVGDAQVWEGDRPRVLLLNLPSEPTLFLVDLQAMTAFAVRREDAVIARGGSSVKAKERFAWSVPVSSGPPGGMSFGFAIGDSRVEVRRKDAAASAPAPSPVPEPGRTGEKATPAPSGGPSRSGTPSTPGTTVPPGAPGPEATPAPKGPDASGCVSLETRPATGVPGCTRFVYVKNSCDAPVVALVQRTEHLMTGTLPQSFTVPVPPGEQWLGCSWWSGGMAPAKHELLGATYVEASQHHSRNGQRPPPKR